MNAAHDQVPADPALFAVKYAVVIGHYHDGSGISDFAYGPYPVEVAGRIAADLQAGGWHHYQWTAVPFATFPGSDPA